MPPDTAGEKIAMSLTTALHANVCDGNASDRQSICAVVR